MTEVVHTDDGEPLSSTRRIRHIASIQVRNLTAFPVRDAFTSAMSQSSDLSQGGSQYAADDINLTASRRRIRKVSTNSMGSKSVIKWDDAVSVDEGLNSGPNSTIRGRKTSGSKVNFNTTPGGTIRGNPFAKGPRPRTSSKASSASSRTFGSSSFGGASSTAPIASSSSSFLSDNTQKGLEKVIGSRLLETCLIISVQELRQTLEVVPLSPHSTHHSFNPKGKTPISPLSSTSNKNHLRTISSPPLPSIPTKSPSSDSPLRVETHEQSPGPTTPVHSRNHVQSPGTPTRTRSKFSKLSNMSVDLTPPEPTQLNYLSPIHRPSTNPEYTMDAAFLPHVDEWNKLKAQSLSLIIWGKIPLDTPGIDLNEPMVHPLPYPEPTGFKWKVLDEWEVDLTDLIPVADEVANRTDFPSNTLLITLSPPGRTYRVPSRRPPSSLRLTSPSGYSSDPESTGRRQSWQTGDQQIQTPEDRPSHRSRRRGPLSTQVEDLAKTATWPDIFQLATLQAYIIDNNTSLDLLIRKIDEIVQDDDVFPLKREISELEDRIADSRKDRDDCIDFCSQKKSELQRRRADLNARREALLVARDQDEEFVESREAQEDDISSEKESLESLRSNIASICVGLVANLAEIFPIELVSPPDLLFTILDAPLPIPLASNDPGPPLMLANHKDVNEDSIAAALGFVAEVLQLLSAYMGTSLLYPVTCIGSRSLIRDGISSMVGPRTFPLYSKGVDTYRFEYGVFLLNKNVELLMAEKDLRALDMRHTLPNLKNLLLILSHDSSGRPKQRKRKPPESDTACSSILELTPGSGPSAEHGGGTGKGEGREPVSESTPPRSGATTPTPSNADEGRKGRSFLGFALWRGRAGAGADEEEDKQTIHGVACDDVIGTGTEERAVV